MNVSDINEGKGADIGITFSELGLERNIDTVEALHIGDHVAFNATLISLGDLHHLHHLRVFDIQKIDGHMDVQSHTHREGRYKLKLEHDNDKLEKADNTNDSIIKDII